MPFVFAGMLIKKDLPQAIRDKLVLDEYVKVDKKTGRENIYRRVSYYDEKRKFNVYVASRKIGERMADGTVNATLRRKSPLRCAESQGLIDNNGSGTGKESSPESAHIVAGTFRIVELSKIAVPWSMKIQDAAAQKIYSLSVSKDSLDMDLKKAQQIVNEAFYRDVLVDVTFVAGNEISLMLNIKLVEK